MSNTLVQLKKKDFETPNDVRWCPGCGDYSILATVQRTLPELNIPKEKFVFVSGIGCSSRFPYYMNTYGFHTIHGRAPAFATGIKVTNPELSVWMITGDGDALSIGGNHALHLLRRNVDINVILFNNRIYGLTKGQYSPTSEAGKKTGSTPFGSIDHPVNPLKFALGAESSFVARCLDVDAKLLGNLLKESENHKGCAFIEVMQNCNIFNDGAWEHLSDKKKRPENLIYLEHGKPLIFGKEKDKGIVIDKNFKAKVVGFEAGNEEEAIKAGVFIHDQSNLILAQILTTLSNPECPVPVGIIYKANRPSFEQSYIDQEKDLKEKSKLKKDNIDNNLEQLYNSGHTWNV